MACWNNAYGSYQKWFIGNDIRTILLADDDIVEQIGNNIFPIVAPEDTKGDFIVYMRTKYAKQIAKGGVYEDDCDVAVIGISDNYDSAISLASKIDNALSGTHTLSNGVKIQIALSDSTEVFEDNKYIETLIFKIK